MSEAQREPCPRCGEPAALSAKVCPFCRGSLLVDVTLDAPVTDPRARYQLSREIAAFGPPAAGFSALQQALASPRPVLARDASRLAALRLAERLADFGLHATLEPADTSGGAPASRGSRRFAVVVAAVAVLAALLWMRPRSGGADRTTIPPAGGIDPAAPAKIPSWPTPPPQLAPRDLSVLARPAVVRLRSGSSGTLHEVSGFVVAPDLVLTSSGVDAGGDVEVSLPDGRELPGEVLKRDGRLDLAVVHVADARAEPLQLGDASALRSGSPVFVPSASSGSALRQGAVGAVARQFQGVAFLALDADLVPADAGGPVLDARGQVVGIVALRKEGSFLLPINYAYQESSLVDPPRPGPNLKKWNELLAQVDAAERLRVGSPR